MIWGSSGIWSFGTQAFSFSRLRISSKELPTVNYYTPVLFSEDPFVISVPSVGHHVHNFTASQRSHTRTSTFTAHPIYKAANSRSYLCTGEIHPYRYPRISVRSSIGKGDEYSTEVLFAGAQVVMVPKQANLNRSRRVSVPLRGTWRDKPYLHKVFPVAREVGRGP